MKAFALTLCLTLLAGAAFAGNIEGKDCSSSEIRYRKVADKYRNWIARQWACAAALKVPFEKRDTSLVVRECFKTSTLYREINGGETACEILVAEDGTKYFLTNEVDGLAIIPKLQSVQRD